MPTWLAKRTSMNNLCVFGVLWILFQYYCFYSYYIATGQGSLQTHSGLLYEGFWERGYRHGFGVLAKRNENGIFTLLYINNWKNGRLHGSGRKFKDGSYFEGVWKNGKRYGFGLMWYEDGSFFCGNWSEDMRDGLGMLVRTDGNRYEGAWSKDMKHGKGRFFHLNSRQMQEGVWHEDVCVYSTIVDIPFPACEPTPLPINPLELREFQELCQKREAETLNGKLNSCASVL